MQTTRLAQQLFTTVRVTAIASTQGATTTLAPQQARTVSMGTGVLIARTTDGENAATTALWCHRAVVGTTEER